MANSSQQESRSKKRTIIIPSGTLNEDETTIIHVPRKLNTAAPLLVSNYRDETYLKVQSLPIWNDELSSEDTCFPDDHWNVQGAGCTDKETIFTTLVPLQEPGQDCTQTSEYLNYDHNFLVTPDTPEDYPGACPPTCSTYLPGNGEFNPNQNGEYAYGAQTSQINDSQASSRKDGPPCCFDSTNPNISYDFRPVYECDFPDSRQ